MTRLIVVSGPGSTGKTTAIKLSLEHAGIFIWRARGDITMVVPIKKDARRLKLGIASGGDDLARVKANLSFLLPHKCDVIICAARSRGATIKALTALKFKTLVISTVRVPSGRIKSYNKSVAADIWQAI